MMKKRQTKKDDYHHGNLDVALTRVALNYIKKHGNTNFSMRQLARQMGVSHTAPYRHFPTKNHLLHHIRQKGFDAFDDALIKSQQDIPSNEYKRRFVSMGMAYVHFITQHPHYANIMFGQSLDPINDDDDDTNNACFKRLLTMIDELKTANVFTPIPTKEIALQVWTSVHGFSVLSMGGAITVLGDIPEDLSVLAKALCETIFEGLKT